MNGKRGNERTTMYVRRGHQTSAALPGAAPSAHTCIMKDAVQGRREENIKYAIRRAQTLHFSCGGPAAVTRCGPGLRFWPGGRCKTRQSDGVDNVDAEALGEGTGLTRAYTAIKLGCLAISFWEYCEKSTLGTRVGSQQLKFNVKNTLDSFNRVVFTS